MDEHGAFAGFVRRGWRGAAPLALSIFLATAGCADGSRRLEEGPPEPTDAAPGDAGVDAEMPEAGPPPSDAGPDGGGPDDAGFDAGDAALGPDGGDADAGRPDADAAEGGVPDARPDATTDGGTPECGEGSVVVGSGVSLMLCDIVAADRTTTMSGTEYFHVQSGGTWSNHRQVHLIGSDGTYHYSYPDNSFRGYLAVSHTFNTKAPDPYTVTIDYVALDGGMRTRTLYFPAFTTTDGRKMTFYVAPDGSSYYADLEHNGYNTSDELLSPEDAIVPAHLARAAP